MVHSIQSSHINGQHTAPVLKTSAKQAQVPAEVPENTKAPAVQSGASVQVTLSVRHNTHVDQQADRTHVDQQAGSVNNSAEVAMAQNSGNPYANTILSHISGRLHADVADGASKEDLQARLEAGLQGFLQGYNEAADMLGHLGVLDDSLSGAIADTYHQVLNGISELAEKLGLEQPAGLAEALKQVPVPENNGSATAPPDAAPASPQSGIAQLSSKVNALDEQKLSILESYQKAVKEAQTYTELARSKKATQVEDNRYSASARSFSFEVVTKNGDRVSILAKAAQATAVQHNDNGVERVSKHSSNFQFSVEGDLNKDEMRAITDLLDKVNQIAETFFSGKVERAFKMAQSLGYDSDQIAEFAVNLNMANVERISNAYRVDGEGAGSASPKVSWAPLVDFAQMVRDAGDQAERLGQKRTLVAELADTVARNLHSDRQDAGAVGDFVKRFV